MRRTPAPVSALAAVVLLGALALAGLRPAIAQDATPPPGEEGVTFAPLGFGTAEELPPAPVELVLARVTLAPGAGFPIEADDPSVGLAYVESGALTIRVEAPLRVTRAATIAAFATPGAAGAGAVPGPEEVPAGTEVTLEAGDSVVIPANVAGEVRNDGAEPAVGLAALVAPPEEGDGATPAAATPAG
jgi:quercetin dioxygenase-like cupin family protein